MKETDVSVQIYSFLEVTAVRYDEKPDKNGQRCDIRDISIRRNHQKERAWQFDWINWINQPAAQ